MADAGTAARVERMGMKLVQPNVGLAALGSILSASSLALSSQRVISVVPFLMRKFVSQLPGIKGKGFSSGPLLFLEQIESFGTSIPAADYHGGLSGVGMEHTSKERSVLFSSLPAVQETVMVAAIAVIGSSLDLDASLMDSGLDSLGSVELRNNLSRDFCLDLPASLTFDYPTVRAVSEYIWKETGGRSATPQVLGDSRDIQLPSKSIRDGSRVGRNRLLVGISGVSLKFSGAINSLKSLHMASAASLDLHQPGPFDRWDLDSLNSYCPDPHKISSMPGSVLTNIGTYVDTTHCFDPTAFGLSISEASLIDPHSRKLLESAYTALHDSDRRPSSIASSQSGVFVGVIWDSEFSGLLSRFTPGRGALLSLYPWGFH